MKKLLLLFILTQTSTEISAAISLSMPTSNKVKIVNQRRHKLMLGELHRALETATNTLRRYKRQNELNKDLPVRSRIIPKQSDVQKHLATYAMLKNIYDEYVLTEQLFIPLELLTDFVDDETKNLILIEAAEQKRMEDELATALTDEQMSF
jgi:hypothetical protein